MTKHIINVTAQAKAVRNIITQYTDEIANSRYVELKQEMAENEAISQLVNLIGLALQEEETRLENEIERDLLGKDSVNVYFDNYRYCRSNSREMKITLSNLLGW